MGLRHEPGHRRRRSRDLVDGAVPGPRHRAPGHRVHAGRRGPERRAEPADPQATDPPASIPCGYRSREANGATVGGPPVLSSATSASGTGPRVTRSGPSTGSRSRSDPVRRSGLVGESGCGKSTLGEGSSGCCRTAPPSRRRGAVTRDVDWWNRAEKCASCAGPSSGLIFQEPMTRLDPLLRSRATSSRRSRRTSRSARRTWRCAGRVARGARRDGHPANPLQAVPARVLGRHASTDHDRPRARPGTPKLVSPTSRPRRST